MTIGHCKGNQMNPSQQAILDLAALAAALPADVLAEESGLIAKLLAELGLAANPTVTAPVHPAQPAKPGK